MQLSLFVIPVEVKESILWCVPRSHSTFVVAVCPGLVVGQWFITNGCRLFKSARVPSGVAFLVQVPPALVSSFKALPSGGGGSRHPSNYIGF